MSASAIDNIITKGNGQNGKSGLTADSVYFKVKQPKTIVKRDGQGTSK